MGLGDPSFHVLLPIVLAAINLRLQGVDLSQTSTYTRSSDCSSRNISSFRAQSSTTVSRPPPLQSLRPLPRRPNHTPSASASSSRRGSLPNILHQSTAKAAPSQPALSPHHDNANVLTPSDDIFSNLSTFTFGAARPPAQRTDSAISPFTVATANGGDTPWQSIQTSNRTTRARSTLRIGSRDVQGGLRSDEDEEEAARAEFRSKLRKEVN